MKWLMAYEDYLFQFLSPDILPFGLFSGICAGADEKFISWGGKDIRFR
jgi:hypothetical protein